MMIFKFCKKNRISNHINKKKLYLKIAIRFTLIFGLNNKIRTTSILPLLTAMCNGAI